MNLETDRDIQKFFENTNISNVIALKRMKYGITNKVYKVVTSDNNYLLKEYVGKYNKRCKKDLLDHCLKQNINVPVEITKQKINNRLFYLYEFIDGYHKKKLKINDICLLVKTVSLLDKKVSIKDYQNDNIFAKMNDYVQYLKNISTYKVSKKTIYELITKYESLDFSNLNFYLVHGDLSSQNMLWKNHTLYLIDFDEAIVATQEYEVISSVIKLCFHYNDFDIQLAKELLKEYENQMNLSIQNLKCMWEFYILKVILEKIALYQMGKIDLSDPRQKKDGWEKWHNLLNDLNLKQVLFE